MISSLVMALVLLAQPVPAWATLPPETKAMLLAESMTEEMYARVAAGKTVTMSRPTPVGKAGVRVAAFKLIHSSQDLVFEAVSDCKRMPEFMPHFEYCKIVPSDTPLPPNERWNENQLNFGFFPLKVKINITQHAKLQKPSRLSWSRVKGDTKHNEGYWHIVPLAEGQQLLVYDTLSDPGTAVPEIVQRILTENDLPKTVEAVKKRVEETLAKR
jgi:coenzyme Q-binding protein COQ10